MVHCIVSYHLYVTVCHSTQKATVDRCKILYTVTFERNEIPVVSLTPSLSITQLSISLYADDFLLFFDKSPVL